jgi:hypothetical protein
MHAKDTAAAATAGRVASLEADLDRTRSTAVEVQCAATRAEAELAELTAQRASLQLRVVQLEAALAKAAEAARAGAEPRAVTAAMDPWLAARVAPAGAIPATAALTTETTSDVDCELDAVVAAALAEAAIFVDTAVVGEAATGSAAGDGSGCMNAAVEQPPVLQAEPAAPLDDMLMLTPPGAADPCADAAPVPVAQAASSPAADANSANQKDAPTSVGEQLPASSAGEPEGAAASIDSVNVGTKRKRGASMGSDHGTEVHSGGDVEPAAAADIVIVDALGSSGRTTAAGEAV